MTYSLSSVHDLCKTRCTAWRSVDIELMLSLVIRRLSIGEVLTRYWNRTPALIRESTAWALLPKEFAVIRGSAFVYTKRQTSLLTTLFPEPFEGELPATLGLGKLGEGWRIVQCHESRQLDLAQEMAFALDA